MQLKRNKDLEFETLKKSHKKEMMLGALVICVVGGILTYATSRARYKLTQDIPLVRGTVNYKVPDLRVVALYTANDSGTYIEANDIPTSGYELNLEKSMCKVYDGTTSIENAPKDNNVTIEYKDGAVTFANITKKNTRCYLYFDKLKDTEKPIISDVATSVTKTEITATVTASDKDASGATVAPTEYWYAIDSGAFTKGTGNTYIFNGLTAGTTHTIQVYVKDDAGNISDTIAKEVTTTSPTSEDTLAKLNITAKTTTPNFSKAATTDEGVFKVADGMYGGYSYYWRGAVTNNYVEFAGFCWRIIRINGDGTIRLIYDGTTCHANGTSTAESIAKTRVAYNQAFSQSNYVGWTYEGNLQRPTDNNTATVSNAKTQLEDWYNTNITGTNATKVAEGKYCNDRNVPSGYVWAINGGLFYYTGYNRIITDRSPTLACPNEDVYILSVGLITGDEVMYAGGTNANNTSYYLYNRQNYWTMSPSYWSGSYARVFLVRYDGFLDGTANVNGSNLNSIYGLRPVINLRSDVTFSSGNGSQSNPYVVS